MDITTLFGLLKDAGSAYLFSYLLAVFLASYWPGNWIVLSLHQRIFSQVPISEDSRGFIALEFNSPAAAWIGRAERAVYIYGLMFGQPGVITGVLILKAFFSWTDKFLLPTPHGTATTLEARRKDYADMISNYHVYVVGNLLSLIVGLAIGELGVLLFPPLLFHLELAIAGLV